MRGLLISLLLCLCLDMVSATGGEQRFTVVMPAAAGQKTMKTALIISEKLGQATGRTVNVTTRLEEEGVIPIYLLISENSHPDRKTAGPDTPDPEGYLLSCDGKGFTIEAKTENGLLYGGFAFLEEVAGIRLYAPGVFRIPDVQRISLKPFTKAERPCFIFREIHGPYSADPEYLDWHRLHRKGENSEPWGMWVHTFQRLVPPDIYFVQHPEYFSLVGGIRVTDGQLCLSNPEVFRILTENLRAAWELEPEARYWSVSQNDTYKNCECDGCKHLDSLYGGPSGTMIWFVNQVAESFPDKVISTLAYQYTRQAPTNIVPRKNVNIMLCTIECDRGGPISERDPGFVRDLKDWRRLSSNILIWDYVVQFRNYVDPFPNLHVLQPNLKLFRDYGAALMFQQGSGSNWSDMIELKQYLIAKLLWNPELDVRATTEDFLSGYYEEAGPWIGRYLDLMHDSLERKNAPLYIYGYPFDGFRTYMTPGLLKQYGILFDEAEKAVAGKPTVLDRVRKARLPLDFAILDISLHEPGYGLSWFLEEHGKRSVDPAMEEALNRFVDRTAALGVDVLDENGTTPMMYKESADEFLSRSTAPDAAFGKAVTLARPASEKYPVGGAAALTDGKFGVNDYHFNWLGFEGDDMDALIDLGEMREIRDVRTSFLQFNQAWIFLPSEVSFSLSADGISFSDPVSVPAAPPPQQKGSFRQDFKAETGSVRARYVRVRASSLKVCPPWHGGHGLPCWIFCDEVVVN